MFGAHRLAGNKVTMDMLAASLGGMSALDRPVVNRTMFAGVFDFEVKFSPELLGTDGGAADPAAPPNIFTALQEQLGLKLKSTRAPFDVLVVDHVEQPSPN